MLFCSHIGLQLLLLGCRHCCGIAERERLIRSNDDDDDNDMNARQLLAEKHEKGKRYVLDSSF